MPDIKELKETKLSVATASNASAQIFGRATTERIRSRSIQHSPIVISGPTSVSVRPKHLFKSSTQDDLMASLEFMNSLAADLPSNGNNHNVNNNNVNVINNNKGSNSGPLWLTATSPLKRSHTVQARRVVKIGNGTVTVVKPQLQPQQQQQFMQQQQQQHQHQQLPPQQQQQNEVMRKPPLPKLSLASPTSTQPSQSFSMLIPVHQQQQQPYPPSHYSGPVGFYRNNGSFVHSGLTPTVKAILSPSVCEQPVWPHQHAQLYHQPQPQQQQENYHYGNQYLQASSPRLSRPTELFVREIPLNDPGHRSSDEPPVQQRASSEGPQSSSSDVPPPLPARKFRRALTSGDVMQQQQPDAKDDKSTKPSSTTQTSPRLFRTALSIDSGVLMGSPSPPTDSGIGVSPPTQVRQTQQQKTKITLKARNKDDSEADVEITTFVPKETMTTSTHRQRQRVVSSDDSASICSSALSVESDTSGSRYDNVTSQKIPSASSNEKTSTTTSLVKAAADIAESRFLTTGGNPTHTRDDDGDDENDTDEEDNDDDYDSDNIDIDSTSESDSEPDDKIDEPKDKPDKNQFRKPIIRLPVHRNSGPYENFKPDANSGECCDEPTSPHYSSEGCSSSSFSSNTSSPKMIDKKSTRSLKRAPIAKDPLQQRPDLPPRENGGTFQARRQQLQQHLQRHGRSSSEGLTSVVSVGGNAHTDTSLRHFLAAGQTSNV